MDKKTEEQILAIVSQYKIDIENRSKVYDELRELTARVAELRRIYNDPVRRAFESLNKALDLTPDE